MEIESRIQENTKGTPKPRQGFYARRIKRPMDFLLALIALIILSPLLLTVAVLVRIKLGSPCLFSQGRIGQFEKPFTMYKFRSMADHKDENGELLPDADRITKLGFFLRRSSIDELPALWNVLRGDMSLVGPRPLPLLYLPYFTEEERKRHSLRGGITGLAQVNGRNALSWEEKFQYDLMYVSNITFCGDVKIAIRTLKKVFQGADIGLRGISGPEDFNVYRGCKEDEGA